MTKQQKLRMTADAFLAALVCAGYRGPFRQSHLDWELPFYRAWRRWEPQQRKPSLFPTFGIGGSADGRTSQARDMLFQVKRTSPFHDYADTALTTTPFGLTPREFLEIWARAATPDEWVALAQDFLNELGASAGN